MLTVEVKDRDINEKINQININLLTENKASHKAISGKVKLMKHNHWALLPNISINCYSRLCNYPSFTSLVFKQRIEYMINDYKVRDSNSLEMRVELKQEDFLGFY